MNSPGLRSLPLHSGNTNRGHPTSSTRETSPENSPETFVVGEGNCAYLTLFETVVLVDDSNSIYGPRWQHTRDLLALIEKVVATFNPNGLRIHFSSVARIPRR